MTTERNYIPGTEIEVIHPERSRGDFRHAIFDFDGTISLVRSGWQAEMKPMMIELILETPKHESKDSVERLVVEMIDTLTGKQTIYQMIQLAEEIRKRGGEPRGPSEYKKMFQRRLDGRVEARLKAIGEGKLQPDDLMIDGAREILQGLKERGVSCYLASGTDHEKVLHDIKLLAIDHFFKDVQGAREDYWNFSKRQVLETILKTSGLPVEKMIAFGDGYADMEESHQLGVMAVGLATDEESGRGLNDEKRAQLIEAGADLILPNFNESKKLLDYLFCEL